ncbi:MAG: AAA family ATPase, partial [SAR324 cluster bacterium]|nr:AAA family ATPase [SAR324 cluster bacterium]
MSVHAEIPEIVRDLLRAESYPHAVELPVRLQQTHISYLLLTGKWAYKIKKPLNLGFLDFSSLEKRKHFCEEELKLNRHFAPELYRAVLPISKSSTGHYRLGQSGTKIVEYALQMQEFPQDSLFRAMFESKTLELQHLQDLGKRLAKWHLDAATSDEIADFGSVKATRAVVEDNFKATAKYIGSVQAREQFEQTRSFQLNFLRDQAQRFSQRQSNNWIRECHGDLHLNNVCWFPDKALLFDCIEFNREFRCIDVIYDTAFMVMDLEYRNRRDLAFGFFNTWVENTGDYEGAAMLNFYAGLRAYVRAKVKSFLLNDPHLPPKQKNALREQTAKFYNLSWKYSQPRPVNCWVVSGLSGSGKSTVAAWLAQQLGAVHIRSDALRKQMSGIALDQRGNDLLYSQQNTERTYDRMLELLDDLSAQGLSVVLDATFGKQEFRKKLSNWSTQRKIALKFVQCTAPESVLIQRLRKREHDISDATEDILPFQQKSFEPVTKAEQLSLISLDTTTDWKKV